MYLLIVTGAHIYLRCLVGFDRKSDYIHPGKKNPKGFCCGVGVLMNGWMDNLINGCGREPYWETSE